MVKKDYKPKHFRPGTMIQFVAAPGRWRSEKPRDVGNGLLGQLAVIIEYLGDDAHQWGGIYSVLLSTGEATDGRRRFAHYGDFMEAHSESR